MSDNSDPIGIVLLKDEPESIILLKWIAWLIVMVLFVVGLIWYSNYFSNRPVCKLEIQN